MSLLLQVYWRIMTAMTCTMSTKEVRYMQACIRLATGTTSAKDEAERSGVTLRHMRRLFKRWKEGSEGALAHRSRGRPGPRKIPPEVMEKAISFIKEELEGYSPAYAKEVLAEEHDIHISPPTLRKAMAEAGIAVTRYRVRSSPRHTFRERKPYFGMMIQCDGSFHQWFGTTKTCLLVMIDDATGLIKARFAYEEELSELLALIKDWIREYGIPSALYCDQRNAYVPTPEGNKHFQQVCERLGVQIINAGSPQAKGRVERVNKTLQGRLCAALKRAGISTLTEANCFLPAFLAAFNERFALKAWGIHNAHVPLDAQYDLDHLFGKRSFRVCTNDYTIRYQTRSFQILKGGAGLRPGMRVEIYAYLDGRIQLFYKGRTLTMKEVAMAA